MHEFYIKRCLALAQRGRGNVAPNPMVGSVVVHNKQIIGEGFHRQYGSPHAEVNAINSVQNQELLSESIIYVNLEPCSHFGKTPPCSNLIIEKKIPKVVVSTLDVNPLVAGRGIEMLKSAGCEVIIGVLEFEAKQLNSRFFTFHEHKRPYIILKFAQSQDGFLDVKRNYRTEKPKWITNELSRVLVHKWRSEEQAILIGTNTALYDNPNLNTRNWSGKNPLRIVIDRCMRLPSSLHIFDNQVPTIIYTDNKYRIKSGRYERENIKFRTIDFHENSIIQILNDLHTLSIQSVIVEGGRQILQSFIDSGLWDEARIFVGCPFFYEGTKAPFVKGKVISTEIIGDSKLLIIKNIPV